MDAVDLGRRGPGPFITLQVQRLPNGRHLVAHSRRYRKGLPPHTVTDLAGVRRLPSVRGEAFLHVWAPRRLAWWVALLFVVGSAFFAIGGVGATWPRALPTPLADVSVVNRIFVVGAIFFTGAAWLQWLEALNADVAEALRNDTSHRWRWLGWRPRNLGYLASTAQLAGTVLFNVDTLDATLTGLSWREEDLLVWTPDMLGCACFLTASCLAFAEVSQGLPSFAPRSASWWIAVLNLLGSLAFQVSALYAFVGPAGVEEGAAFRSGGYTVLGALCFLAGSYLMMPELFDEQQAGEVV